MDELVDSAGRPLYASRPSSPAVRFLHKLHKVASGDAWESARRHAHRLLTRRRGPAVLDAATIMGTIDQEKFEEIRRRYHVDNPGGDPPKYLDWRTWLAANVRRIRDLELDRGRRRRVLDIGCGNGYFLYICTLLGHDAVGLDIGDMKMFTEMTRLLGVRRVEWRIEAFQPLPDLGAPFDAITAHLICFNNHKHANLWDTAEWNFFLDDLASWLTPRGRIRLELNRELDGSFYTSALRALFERRGARVHENQVAFARPPRPA